MRTVKILILVLLLSSQLFSQSFYTLDNVRSLNLYFATDAGFFTPERKTKTKKMLHDKLKEAGFVFGETDAYIFVVKVETLSIEDSVAIYLQVGLGEEVITKRKDNIETFAYTYLEHQLVEGYDPYEDTIESLNALVDNFIDAYKDDNEE